MVRLAVALIVLLGAPKKAVAPAASLHVRSIDLKRRMVLVELGGVPKVPSANLFTFTDERGRHYVAMSIHCEEPFPSGIRACELEIPPGYQKHKLVSLAMHTRSLKSKSVAADAGEIAAAWPAPTVAPATTAPVDGGAHD